MSDKDASFEDKGVSMSFTKQIRGWWQSTALKKELSKRKAQFLLRKQVARMAAGGGQLRVVIGSGGTNYEGWVMTDLPILNALETRDWGYLFKRGSVYRVLAEHVIEHWREDEFRAFLRIVRPFLAEGGFVRLAVPDGFHPDPAYIDHVRVNGVGPGADDHKMLYNYVMVTKLLSEAGYDYRLLEYFDENGGFHQMNWEATDGFVKRSAGHDPRNAESPLSYTSLIVDTWPGSEDSGFYV